VGGLHTSTPFTQPHDPCEPCALGKQTRSPLVTSTNPLPTTVPLEIVQFDTMGPFSTPTPSGGQYLSALVDDFSKLGTVIVTRFKTEIAPSVQSALIFLESKTGLTIQKLVRRAWVGSEIDSTMQHPPHTSARAPAQPAPAQPAPAQPTPALAPAHPANAHAQTAPVKLVPACAPAQSAPSQPAPSPLPSPPNSSETPTKHKTQRF